MPKLIDISMEWNDAGAKISSSIPLYCPRCGYSVSPGVDHACGDRVPKLPTIRRSTSAKS
jgi:hypothetical protein